MYINALYRDYALFGVLSIELKHTLLLESALILKTFYVIDARLLPDRLDVPITFSFRYIFINNIP